jgi:hypothetical protein
VGVYRCFSYTIYFASCFACAGLLSSTYLAKMSSSVSMSSSGIVSNICSGFVVFWLVVATVLVIMVFGPAAVVTYSYFSSLTHSDVPSRSSTFFILLRTPST